MGYSRSIEHCRGVGTARGCGRNLGQCRSECPGQRGAGSPRSGPGCSGLSRPAWPGWARTLQSHSGDLARSFSWKGSSRRHSPRSCSSMAGSSTALTAGSSGPGLLLGACPLRAVTQRALKATSSTRPATRAAPTSMSAWRRKVLTPAREKPRPHPSAPAALTQSPTSPLGSSAWPLPPSRNPHACLQARACLPNLHPREILQPRARSSTRMALPQKNPDTTKPKPRAATQRLKGLLQFPSRPNR